MIVVGVAKEVFPGERRVAMVPAILPSLTKAGLEVVVEPGAGLEAGYPDEAYVEKGAKIAADRAEVFAADVVFQVRSVGAAGEAADGDLPRMKKGVIVIGMADPLGCPEAAQKAAETGATLFALELVPRITRAQSMDVLSSMATIAGYRAVLLAATSLPKMFPMMMTAAGTIAPARVFIVGAGVAGLQAIASSKRLGAIVSAYDVRPVVKEQVESLGGKFLEIQMDTNEAEDKGGYAKQLDDEAIKKQRELMLQAVAESDVVITTAAVPGKKAPILLTAEMVGKMNPGSVIVDLAAERGGNCELTKPGETVVDGGVTILGPANLPAEIPFHASQMYAKNIATFLLNMVKDGQLNLDMEDEITRETLVTQNGKIANPRVAEILGIEIEPPAKDAD
jgi:proton-translocating NAD(P)+ transhydrogenase subunit alpha